jgi:hypothetical protein
MTIIYDSIPNEIVTDVMVSTLVESTQDPSRAAGPLPGLKPTAAPLASSASFPVAPRGTGGHINRFLLCVLATRSAKEIKEKAQGAGQRLLMTTIVKQVLTSYSQAEEEAPGLLSGPGSQLRRLNRLNKKVLNDQINGCAQDKVKDSQKRFDRATRQGDEGKIKAEKETLVHDMAECERIASEFR